MRLNGLGQPPAIRGIFSVLWMTCLIAPIKGQEIRNVTAQQRPGTGIIDIWYDLDGLSADGLGILVKYDLDGGFGGYPFQAATLEGDAGSGVSPGPGRHIVWHAQADLPAGTRASQAKVSVCLGLSIEPPSATLFETTGRDLSAYYLNEPYMGGLRWLVNGIENGNAEVGAIQPLGGGQAHYTAPALPGGVSNQEFVITAETTDLAENFSGAARITVAAKRVAVSAQVGFLNALPAGGTTERAAFSPLVGYFNSIVVAGDRAAFSPLTSYLNALEEPERFQASGVVSYENQ
jgi:hypothetical protein